MSQRDRGQESTVFERELLGYARHRESRRRFVSRVTATLTERPGTYVHVERWTGPDRLLRAVHQDPAAPAGPHGLAATFRTEVELLVGAGRMALNGAPADAARRSRPRPTSRTNRPAP